MRHTLVGLALSLTLLLCIAANAAPRLRAIAHPGILFPRASRLLLITAHPDDEVLAAPLLGRICLDGRIECTILVLTHGEASTCLRPEGCLPDLATVRAEEMRQSASLFNAGLILWDLPDTGGADGSPTGWERAAGGHDLLVSSIAAVVDSSAADVVVSFDPRHGTTCHADHRALGGLAVEAVSRSSNGPPLYLLETYVEIMATPFALRFVPAIDDPGSVIRIDGSIPLRPEGETGWASMLAAMRLHVSQFDGPWISAVDSIPDSDRAVFLSDAASALQRADIRHCSDGSACSTAVASVVPSP